MEEIGVYSGLFFSLSLRQPFFQPNPNLVCRIDLTEAYSVPLLISVASVGNTLGAVINWLLGRFIDRFVNRNGFRHCRTDGARSLLVSKIRPMSLLLLGLSSAIP